jgi:hypothetical protein
LTSPSDLSFPHALVEHGADVTGHADDGRTLMHEVLTRENVELARFLAEHGTDAKTARDDAGGHPFMRPLIIYGKRELHVIPRRTRRGHDSHCQHYPVCTFKNFE